MRFFSFKNQIHNSVCNNRTNASNHGAHKVAEAKAQKVADALNGINYKLDDKHVWYVHDVDQYDNAFYYAESQRFTYGKNGTIKRIA